MLGGWEAGIALLLDAGGGEEGVDEGWFGAPSLSFFAPSLPLWYAGALLLSVHFPECNQSVSRSRLNQSLPHHQHLNTLFPDLSPE